MTLPNTSLHANKGFTLIEIVVVVAILTTMIGLGLFMSMDSYRAFVARSEVDTMVSVLERARSRAMANIHQTTWGVCYIAPNYILFRGTSCVPGAETNEATPGSRDAVVVGLESATPVVFLQLSGATTGTVVTVTQQTRVSTITINHEGAIIW